MSLTSHTTVLTTNTTQTPCPWWDFFFLILGFSPLIHLYCWSPFCPACHLMFHAIVHVSNTTQASMPLVGFEPTILVSERPKTHALDRTATGIDLMLFLRSVTSEGYKAALNNKTQTGLFLTCNRAWWTDIEEIDRTGSTFECFNKNGQFHHRCSCIILG
jgi:hypothetical protein